MNPDGLIGMDAFTRTVIVAGLTIGIAILLGVLIEWITPTKEHEMHSPLLENLPTDIADNIRKVDRSVVAASAAIDEAYSMGRITDEQRINAYTLLSQTVHGK